MVLLDRGERLAGPDSEFAGTLTESVEDILFPRDLHLLPIKGILGPAPLRAQGQHVVASEASDRAFGGPRCFRFACRLPARPRALAAHPGADPSGGVFAGLAARK